MLLFVASLNRVFDMFHLSNKRKKNEIFAQTREQSIFRNFLFSHSWAHNFLQQTFSGDIACGELEFALLSSQTSNLIVQRVYVDLLHCQRADRNSIIQRFVQKIHVIVTLGEEKSSINDEVDVSLSEADCSFRWNFRIDSKLFTCFYGYWCSEAEMEFSKDEISNEQSHPLNLILTWLLRWFDIAHSSSLCRFCTAPVALPRLFVHPEVLLRIHHLPVISTGHERRGNFLS